MGKFWEGVVMKAMVDQEVCIGCELCVQACPEVFSLEGDKAVACVDLVPSAVADACEQAARDYPAEAITVE